MWYDVRTVDDEELLQAASPRELVDWFEEAVKYWHYGQVGKKPDFDEHDLKMEILRRLEEDDAATAAQKAWARQCELDD